jgi:GntR family transcriptional regulator
MFLVLDATDKRPLYRQLADGIKALIARGDLREGMSLPSVRQVAGDLGVNLNTVAFAYRELQDEGLLAVRHGAGAVVASTRARPAEADELRKQLSTVLTELVLGGLGDRDIERMVRQELALLRRKGETR